MTHRRCPLLGSMEMVASSSLRFATAGCPLRVEQLDELPLRLAVAERDEAREHSSARIIARDRVVDAAPLVSGEPDGLRPSRLNGLFSNGRNVAQSRTSCFKH